MLNICVIHMNNKSAKMMLTKKLVCFLIIPSMLATMLPFLCTTVYGDYNNAYLFLTPSIYIAEQVGEVFNMSIKIASVESLHSFQFKVIFNGSLLNVLDVVPGEFFPQPPDSHFIFEKNESLGFIRVYMSLADTGASVSGGGTLVWIIFKVAQGAESCIHNQININEILLLNSELLPINYDCVGAVYFWRSMQSDPPVEGRLIDVYTQKGGQSLGKFGGTFMLGETVFLITRVTYNNLPVQHKLVSFEVLNPSNESVVLRAAVTDEDGFAMISFRIPSLSSSVGTWKAISVVSIAEEVVWDTVDFQVCFKFPVGGNSFSARNGDKELVVSYLTSVAFLVISFAMFKRKLHMLKP